MQDNMFHVRVATLADLPQLVSLVAQPFTNGALDTAGLSFSQLEISAYLQWRLPRLLLDRQALVYVLEFSPVNSFKKVSSRIVGCTIVRLGASVAPQPLSQLSCNDPSDRHGRSLLTGRSTDSNVFSLRLRSALSDLTVWPDSQTAEVHTRFEAAQAAIEHSADQDATTIVFFFVLPEYQGCGLGSTMLAAVRERVGALGKHTLPLTAIVRDQDVSFGAVSGLKHVKDAGKLKVMEAVC